MPWEVPHLPHPIPEAPSPGDPAPHVLGGQQAMLKGDGMLSRGQKGILAECSMESEL